MLDGCQAIGMQPFFEIPVGFLISLGKEKYDAVVVIFHNNYFVCKLIETSSVCQEKKRLKWKPTLKKQPWSNPPETDSI